MIDDLTHTNIKLTPLIKAFLIMNYVGSYDRCQGLVECYNQIKKVEWKQERIKI